MSLCDVCGAFVPAIYSLDVHNRGQKHRQALAAREIPSAITQRFAPRPSFRSPRYSYRRAVTAIRCSFCHVDVANYTAYAYHSRSQSHYNAVVQARESRLVDVDAGSRSRVRNTYVNYKRRTTLTGYVTAKTAGGSLAPNDSAEAEDSTANRDGISVSMKDGLDFGVIEIDSALGTSERHSVTLTVERTDAVSRIYLARILFSSAAQDGHSAK
jgi:hypothetical protein